MSKEETARVLTGEVLAIEAPNEVPLLAMYVHGADEKKHTAKGPLGFGVAVDAAVSLLLPIVAKFFSELLTAVAHETLTGVAHETSQALVRKFRTLLKAEPKNLTEIQKQVVQATADELTKAGLVASKVESTANTIVSVVLAHKELFSTGV
jgi:hypothetical protein